MDWRCPDHPVVHMFWNIFKKICSEEMAKICVSKQQMKYSMFGKEKEENVAKANIKAYIKTTIDISSETTLTSFDLFSSTARVTSITSTKQESVIGSLHKIQLLKSQVVSIFPFVLFSEKDDFGSDMLAMGMCYL